MTKKFDIDNYLDELMKAQPDILLCSYEMAKRIRAKSGELLDLGILAFLSKLTIRPTDKLPDHIVFLCDKHGNPMRMINLTQRKRWRRQGIKREKEEKFES